MGPHGSRKGQGWEALGMEQAWEQYSVTVLAQVHCMCTMTMGLLCTVAPRLLLIQIRDLWW